MASTENQTGVKALPKLGVDPTGATTFAPIAELIADPTPGEYTRGSIDMTHTDITDGLTEQEGGWGTEGPWTFLFNYTETTYEQLLALKGVDGANWEYSWADPAHTTTDSSDTFIGFATNVSKQTPVGDGRWTITLEITVKRAVTFTEGTSA